MCFVVERDFWKLVWRDVASVLLGFESMMSTEGEATRLGTEVRPEAVETVREVNRGKPVVRCRVCERELPGQEWMNCHGEFKHVLGYGRFHVHVGESRAIQRSEPLH